MSDYPPQDDLTPPEGEDIVRPPRAYSKLGSAIGLIIVFILLGGIAGVATAEWGHIKSLFGGNPAAAQCPKPTTDTVTISVNPGDSGDAIAQALCQAGAILTKQDYINASNQNPQANSIQPGTYKITVSNNADEVISDLLNPANRQNGIVVPEGYRAEQIFQRIASALKVPVTNVETAAKDGAAIGLPSQAGGVIEGWLAPATYPVTDTSTPTSVLKAMIAGTVQTLTADKVPSSQWERTLTFASIIEKEVSLDKDRPIVAGAINNRLAQNMPLQIDSTALYGAGDFTSASPSAAERAAVNGYNTYTKQGLPVGPIATPGPTSITAVLNPTKSTYLYWVTVNLSTGETVFSTTLAEHNVAVAQLRAWEAAHPNG